MPARAGFTHAFLKAKVAVVDYETFYTDLYSVKGMSYWHYCHHPSFRAYLVSIVTNEGFEWVGDPKDAPWEAIRGHVWVSHNRPFDWSVHVRLIELGLVPNWQPVYWGDTCNLCAWLRVPRGLASAMKELYGVVHSKTIRDKDMKGRTWEEFGEVLQARVRTYALDDGRHTLRIWLDHVEKWPLKEIRIADLISDRGLRGLCVDKAGMERDMDLMKKVVFAARSKIPWADDADEKILSHPKCIKECRRLGIPAPASLAMDDEGLIAWEDTYGEKYPFVAAMRDFRRMNAVLKKYQTIWNRIKDDGRFEFSVSYLGTHTGRTSGKDKAEARRGANMLNLPRDPFFIRPDLTVVHQKKELKSLAEFHHKNPGVCPPGIAHLIDLRAKIVAAPGHKFVICDKSQIEARITNWLAGDYGMMQRIREGLSVYEAHAIELMGYKPVFDANGKRVKFKTAAAQTAALAKARELALGFQAGHIKFLVMAHLYIDDEDYDLIFDKPYPPERAQDYRQYLFDTSQHDLLKEFDAGDEYLKRTRIEAWMQVQQYRNAKSKTLVPLWKRLDGELKRSASGGGGANYCTHQVALPSGRVLHYFNVRMNEEGTVIAAVERGGGFKYFYGGKILENAVQATARDCFVEDQLTLDDLGIYVVLDIYDEVVCEVPIDFDESVVTKVMSTTPPWAPGLPVGAETECSSYYKK